MINYKKYRINERNAYKILGLIDKDNALLINVIKTAIIMINTKLLNCILEKYSANLNKYEMGRILLFTCRHGCIKICNILLKYVHSLHFFQLKECLIKLKKHNHRTAYLMVFKKFVRIISDYHTTKYCTEYNKYYEGFPIIISKKYEEIVLIISDPSSLGLKIQLWDIKFKYGERKIDHIDLNIPIKLM